MKHEFAEQRHHCETISQELQACAQELLDSKDLTPKLFEKNAKLVQENKQLEDVIENEIDEIKNLQTAHKTRKEISDKLNKNMNDLKIKHNKEKIDIYQRNTQLKSRIGKKVGRRN